MADAVVIEHPGHAGGHLGAAKLEDVHDERFDFKRVLAECHKLFQELQLGRDAPRLIVAGGVGSHEQVRHWLATAPTRCRSARPSPSPRRATRTRTSSAC